MKPKAVMSRTNPFQPIYSKLNQCTDDYDFPICVDVEVTNLCNFNCLFCPTGNGSISRQRGNMSDATYTKLIDGLVACIGGNGGKIGADLSLCKPGGCKTVQNILLG